MPYKANEPRRPTDAAWLTTEERGWLTQRLDAERSRANPVGHLSLWKILSNKYV
jgi:ACS family tartrate transporter-like MFS transporter